MAMARAWYAGAHPLSRAARPAAVADGRLPGFFALTDPARTPDLSVFEALPPGTGLIHRHFGRPERFDEAAQLAEIAARRGLVLLIAADPALAEAIGAAGVHWPQARLAETARWRRRDRGALFTVSAHGPGDLRRAVRAGADAALLSPVFTTASAGAGEPMGLQRAAACARGAALPVYALGGMDERRAMRAADLGFAGAASVSAAATG